jgi:hypothetical protein
MTSPQAQWAIKEKMERIKEILQELLLDALITALTKVVQHNQVSAKEDQAWKCYRTDCDQRDNIPF